MTTPTPTPRLAALGAVLRARRAELRMSREAVAEAGGPSVATQKRVENGLNSADIEVDTQRAFETGLRLPAGWVTDFLAGRVTEETNGGPADSSVTILQTATGARLLVAVTDGVTRLSASERKVITALIEHLDEESD
jgi:transcriptional regulator with XRE-family HTH domain